MLFDLLRRGRVLVGTGGLEVTNTRRRFLRRLWQGRGRAAKTGHPSQGSLRIEPLESGRGLRLSGELDIFSVESFRKALEPELQGTLVLDLAAVEFMDDSGLGLLVGTVKRLRDQEGSLVLRNPRSQILRVLEITGLVKMPGLTIEHDGGSP